MKKSLFKRLLVSSLSIVFAAVILLSGLLTLLFRAFWMNEKVSVFRIEISSLANQLDQMNGVVNFEAQFRRMLTAMAAPNEGVVFICDKNGNIVLSSAKDFEGYNIGNDALAELNENTSFSEFTDLEGILHQTSFCYGSRFLSGYIVVTTPQSGLVQYLLSLGRIFLFATIIVTVFVIIAVYYIAYRMVRPIKEMSIAAKSMAHGDFTKYIHIDREDEIGELAVAFNKMTKSISQGEQMRRDFVAGVSHELKTPMTTIAGFIDGILDGTIPRDEADRYLKIVSDEVGRLSRLVTDMLNLSRLESGEQTMSMHPTDISKIIVTVTVGFEQRISQKNLEIIGLESLQPMIVPTDRDMIYQVIYNLVDNAIKYSPEGEKIIFSSTEAEKQITCSIKNTGVGIPPDQISHIFDRFYKVDKSRTDAKSGAGLGLYLVKTIIDRHNGSIKVNSVLGEYTEFVFSLPKADLIPEETAKKKSLLQSKIHKED